MKKILFEIIAYSLAVAVGIGFIYGFGAVMGLLLKVLGL